MSLHDLRRLCGSVSLIWQFPGEDKAGEAYHRMYRESESISAWRVCSPDRVTWKVIVIGEPKHADEIAHCDKIAKASGGVPSDLGDQSGMLDALRERRWKQMLSAAAGGPRNEKNHYGPAGAHLYRSGRMEPIDD